MTNEKILSIISAVILFGACHSQDKVTNLHIMLRKRLQWMPIAELQFFGQELVDLAIDTAFVRQFKFSVERQERIRTYSEYDERENFLVLHLLYRSVNRAVAQTPQSVQGKKSLIAILNSYKEINFAIDQSLVLKQIDHNTRSLINGYYDEGTVTTSKFVFLLFDPQLYRDALIQNGMEKRFHRTSAVFCNYLRENEKPTLIRHRLRDEIIAKLNQKEIRDVYKTVIADLKDCDLNSNLYD